MLLRVTCDYTKLLVIWFQRRTFDLRLFMVMLKQQARQHYPVPIVRKRHDYAGASLPCFSNCNIKSTGITGVKYSLRKNFGIVLLVIFKSNTFPSRNA